MRASEPVLAATRSRRDDARDMTDGPEPKHDLPNPIEAIRARIPGRADELLVDKLTAQLETTRGLLLGDPEGAAERALDRMGGQAEAETRIAAQLAMRQPLAQPERFPEAHRLAVHALEVLDREGSRAPGAPRLGPLTAVAEVIVEAIAEYLVKSYAEGVAGTLRKLYARREAQCTPQSPERRALARARLEMERLAPGFSGGGINGTMLLLAGLAVPGLASLSSYVGAIDYTDRRILFGGVGFLFLLFLLLSSITIRGAAVARRRSHLIMSQPLAALWQTIGNCGAPPEDDSVAIATVAIVLTALLWIVGPAVAAVIIVATR